jgi:hypothetical protein
MSKEDTGPALGSERSEVCLSKFALLYTKYEQLRLGKLFSANA